MFDKIEKRNRDRVRCLFFMFIIYPINNLLGSFSSFFNFTPPNNIMIILYIIVMIYGTILFLKYSLTRFDMCTIIAIYLGYIFLYMISVDSAKIEMKSVYMCLMYIYFIPLSVIVISHIENFSELFSEKYVVLSDVLIVITIVSKLFFHDNTDYMIFSYDLLPFWGIIIVSAIHYKKKVQWLFVPIVLIEALVFGCRGALMWTCMCGIFVYVIELLYQKSTREFVNKMMFFPCIILLIIVGVIEVLPSLLKSQYAKSSYILTRLTMGSLSESNARERIMDICIQNIKKMGLNINGLFYDRSILPNGMYSHNIFIEALLSLGWVFGTVFLLFVLKKMVKALNNQSLEGKIIWVYFVAVLFLRYFISGSIFGEGKFVIFISVMIAMSKYCTKSELLTETDLEV